MAIATEYNHYYELAALLEQDESIVAPRPILSFDLNTLVWESLARLAQPLADGTPSPFTSQAPDSAEGFLIAELLYHVELLRHEMNLIPDQTLETFYRLQGVYQAIAEYPVLELQFARTNEAIRNNISAVVPIGTQIESQYNKGFYVITIDELEIKDSDRTGTVNARFYQEGPLPKTARKGEFSILPRPLRVYLESVVDTGVIVQTGRNIESPAELQARARAKIQNPGDRLVTARDYINLALSEGGATKAIPLQGIYLSMGADGAITDRIYRDNTLSLVVYPPSPSLVSNIQALVTARSYWEECFVRPARIIPLDGTIDCRISSHLLPEEAKNLVATAIQDKINPPNGSWGDKNFISNLSTAIENVSGVYAVPNVNLKHAVTGVAFSALEIQPWDLLEIQASTTFNWIK